MRCSSRAATYDRTFVDGDSLVFPSKIARWCTSFVGVMGRRRWPFVALLSLVVGGCSVEGERQLGDECIRDRECATSLRCELSSSGVSRCAATVRLDASPGPAAVDTGRPGAD